MKIMTAETSSWIKPKSKFVFFGAKAIDEIDVSLDNIKTITDFSKEKYPEETDENPDGEYSYIFLDTRSLTYFKQVAKILKG